MGRQSSSAVQFHYVSRRITVQQLATTDRIDKLIPPSFGQLARELKTPVRQKYREDSLPAVRRAH